MKSAIACILFALSSLALPILLAITLSACNLFNRQPTLQIKLESDRHANSDMATALDIVFVYDEKVAAMMPRSAAQWFANKSAMMASAGESIEIVHIEAPVAMPLHAVELPVRHREAIQIMSYANYLSRASQFAANLKVFKCVTITLGYDQPFYKECPEN